MRSELCLALGLGLFASLMSACSGDGGLGRNVESPENKRGPAGGAAGSATAGSASGGSGGSNTADCQLRECFRAVECVASCSGSVVKSGCCPCDAGTFDRLQCSGGGGGAGGSAGDMSAGATSSELLAGLNKDCVAGACPPGLTAIHFYGIAGKAGPEFCWCSLPCSDAATKCPSGTTCTTVSDGPGTVCVAR